MKKSLVLATLFLIILVSGCASRIDAVPIVTHEEVICDDCENVDDTCAKEVKVVHYNDKCSNGCGFPVTIRKNSTCIYGGGM